MSEEPTEAQPKKKPQEQSGWADWINGIINLASRGKTFSTDNIKELQDIGQKERARREQRDVSVMRPMPAQEHKPPVTQAVPTKELEREPVLAAVDLAEQMTVALGRALPLGPKLFLRRWVEGGSRA
jgi:hypothetical protein